MQAILSAGDRAPGYAVGQGDLARITRAGAGMLPPPPSQIGLSPFARQVLTHAILGTGGGAYGAYQGGPGGALGPRAAGSLVRAPFVQRYLQNQAAAGLSPALSKAALAAALAGKAELQR